MFDTIGGLPVHALVVHAVVVLGPLAALMLVAYTVQASRGGADCAGRPWRWPRSPRLSAAVAATSSGESLEERVGDPAYDHAEKGDLAAVSVYVLLRRRRRGDPVSCCASTRTPARWPRSRVGARAAGRRLLVVRRRSTPVTAAPTPSGTSEISGSSVRRWRRATTTTDRRARLVRTAWLRASSLGPCACSWRSPAGRGGRAPGRVPGRTTGGRAVPLDRGRPAPRHAGVPGRRTRPVAGRPAASDSSGQPASARPSRPGSTAAAPSPRRSRARPVGGTRPRRARPHGAAPAGDRRAGRRRQGRGRVDGQRFRPHLTVARLGLPAEATLGAAARRLRRPRWRSSRGRAGRVVPR